MLLADTPKPGGDALAINGATREGRLLHLPPGSALREETVAIACGRRGAIEGVRQREHHDETFIPTPDASLTGVWIALDDATIDNGCLWVQPCRPTIAISGARGRGKARSSTPARIPSSGTGPEDPPTHKPPTANP